MKLQRYNQFINEGIISKGLELLNYKKIEKFVESEYHLSTEEIKNTNGTFKLIDIGDRNKQIQFILEQK